MITGVIQAVTLEGEAIALIEPHTTVSIPRDVDVEDFTLSPNIRDPR